MKHIERIILIHGKVTTFFNDMSEAKEAIFDLVITNSRVVFDVGPSILGTVTIHCI